MLEAKKDRRKGERSVGVVGVGFTRSGERAQKFQLYKGQRVLLRVTDLIKKEGGHVK
jgi:hypothetical protein